MARHGVREERAVMNVLLFLLANTGQPFSLQTLARGLAIPAVSSVSHYVAILQDAYLLSTARWSDNGKTGNAGKFSRVKREHTAIVTKGGGGDKQVMGPYVLTFEAQGSCNFGPVMGTMNI